MAVRSWKQPVAVFASKAGATRWVVGDTLKAAEVLTQHWPRHAQKGAKFIAACEACRDTMAMADDTDRARDAFIEAAREAEILAE